MQTLPEVKAEHEARIEAQREQAALAASRAAAVERASSVRANKLHSGKSRSYAAASISF